MDQQNKRFTDQYATMHLQELLLKRIEREISVSEQGYLELLHGLNLAKIKSKDNELSSDLKLSTRLFYPLSQPN
jgi:hypothetical protein